MVKTDSGMRPLASAFERWGAVDRQTAAAGAAGRAEAGRIDASTALDLDDIAAALGDSPALTVGDSDNFARRGGMVRRKPVDGGIRFESDLGAARSAGLSLSSKRLRPAEIVATANAQKDIHAPIS